MIQLQSRWRTGHGYWIDMALLDCATAAQVNLAQAYLTSGQVPVRQGNAHLQIVPYQLFQTADSYLVLAVGNDGQWQRFCRWAAPDLGAEDRFATNPLRVRNRAELVPALERLLRESVLVQIAMKESAGAYLPAAMMYDIHFDTGAFLISATQHHLCPARGRAAKCRLEVIRWIFQFRSLQLQT